MSVSYILRSWELVFVVLASWVNREQQEVIDYLRTENAILKEKLCNKRLILTDNQRRRLAACTPTLGDELMKQVARNLTDSIDGFLSRTRYILMDRDANFSTEFRRILKLGETEAVRLPAQSPNLNAHLERFHLSIKSECLSRLIFFGEESLRRAVTTYLDYYHRERNHQGLDKTIINPDEKIGRTDGDVKCHKRLGGLLHYYYRSAA